jgi:hypothetical protein
MKLSNLLLPIDLDYGDNTIQAVDLITTALGLDLLFRPDLLMRCGPRKLKRSKNKKRKGYFENEINNNKIENNNKNYINFTNHNNKNMEDIFLAVIK